MINYELDGKVAVVTGGLRASDSPVLTRLLARVLPCRCGI
jgi:hypothetical protein